MGAVHLAYEVVDSQLVDRHEQKIGRVDALLLEAEPGKPLRVATIVIGAAARADRIGRWFAATRRAVRTLLGMRAEHESRIPFSAVRRIGDTIQLDVEERALESEHFERWLGDHVICRIPGASGASK
jgi:hypothetical protein